MSIKVALVEDDSGLRNSLSTLILESPGFSLAGAYPNAEIALKEISRELPQVVLMDINLPKMSGIECVAKLKETFPEIKVLMLTVHIDSDLIFKSLKAGAGGYLIKRSSSSDILDAVRDLNSGGAPMSSAIARKVVDYFKIQGNRDNEVSLTGREREIVEQVAKGYRDKEIADRLHISIPTVRTHVRSIYEKMHVRSRAEAVARYMQKGK